MPETARRTASGTQQSSSPGERPAPAAQASAHPPRGSIRVLLAGGGTGGHLFPALAIARGLRNTADCEIRFVGSSYGLEAQLLPRRNEVLYPLPVRGLQRGLSMRAFWRNLSLPFRFFRAYRRCLEIMAEFRPHVVVGTGGYASAPPLMAAQRRGVPTVLQEQNSYPGLTTRRLARRAARVCLTYEEAAQYLNTDLWEVTGNPIPFSGQLPDKATARKSMNLPPGEKVLFILGGSQGSLPLNRHFLQKWRFYTEQLQLFLLWQTGPAHLDAVVRIVNSQQRLIILPFIDDMAAAYSAVDLVVCRAGAMTLTELTYLGKPSVLVPLPSAAGDHQTKNARTLQKRGAARLVLQSELAKGKLEAVVKRIFARSASLQAMADKARSLARPDATEVIVHHILELARA